MNQENKTTLAASELARIQKELKAPKDQFNKFGKFYYRTTSGILEGLKQVQGNCAITLEDEMASISDRVYVQATATLIASDGSAVSCKAFARESESKAGMDSAQVTGSTSSYARKYALNGLFAIDDTKDSDSETVGDDTVSLATAKQSQEMLDRCNELDVPQSKLFDYLKMKPTDPLTLAAYKKGMKSLDTKAKEVNK